jgi:hypothetical protein
MYALFGRAHPAACSPARKTVRYVFTVQGQQAAREVAPNT